MQYWKAELRAILEHSNPKGFTHYLYGKPRRYVVWLTNNIDWSYEILIAQIELYRNRFDPLTIGGRQDTKRSVRMIDVGTATDSLQVAFDLLRLYKQDCIYDSLRGESIYP